MEPISTRTAEHYVWGEVCDGWHLEQAPELSVIEERMPPGASEQRHRHEVARQFFYVLAGELTMEVDGVVHRLKTWCRAGDCTRMRSSGDERKRWGCAVSGREPAAESWGSGGCVARCAMCVSAHCVVPRYRHAM